MEFLTVFDFEETSNSPGHAVDEEVLVGGSVECHLVFLELFQASLHEIEELGN